MGEYRLGKGVPTGAGALGDVNRWGIVLRTPGEAGRPVTLRIQILVGVDVGRGNDGVSKGWDGDEGHVKFATDEGAEAAAGEVL
jgi:hypothetical protein